MLNSLVEHGLLSGSSGHAHTKLLLRARHKCVHPPLFTPQWFVPRKTEHLTDAFVSMAMLTFLHHKCSMFVYQWSSSNTTCLKTHYTWCNYTGLYATLIFHVITSNLIAHKHTKEQCWVPTAHILMNAFQDFSSNKRINMLWTFYLICFNKMTNKMCSVEFNTVLDDRQDLNIIILYFILLYYIILFIYVLNSVFF